MDASPPHPGPAAIYTAAMPESDEIRSRLAALSDPAAFPDGPREVQVVQTHASMVFLTEKHAWKVKKAVDLGFLDFTRLEDRRRFCEEEVRLNRRTAPEVYLGVDLVVEGDDGRLRVGWAESPPPGRVVDYAVRMRRLSAEGMLDRRLGRGDLALADLSRLAEAIADFHRRCPTGAGIDEHGGPEGMRRQFEDNLARLRPFAGEGEQCTMPEPLWALLQERGLERISEEEPRLRRRVAEGRVREGHGDLHSGNIATVGGRLVAFDAIEFSRPIRCRDTACEIAFLGMDLELRRRPDLAAWWSRAYIRASGDREVAALQPLFRAHYAIVRGLVESIRAAQPEVSGSERRSSRLLAGRYLDAAACLLVRPALVLLCGLPGTGKSTVAAELAEPLGAALLRSDAVRKRRAGIAATVRGDGDLYARERTLDTYAAIEAAAEAAIARGRSAVIDATLPSRELRAPLLRMAERSGRPWCLVEVVCPPEEVRRRLARRALDPSEVSDADYRVHQEAASRFEPPDEIPPRRRLRALSGAPGTLRAVLAALRGGITSARP
jgi:aminoglycoside phosphotransferase family enzyme/predicted kinase